MVHCWQPGLVLQRVHPPIPSEMEVGEVHTQPKVGSEVKDKEESQTLQAVLVQAWQDGW